MDKNRLRALGTVSLVASVLLGCSGGKLAGTPLDGGDDAAPASLSPFLGDWVGYAEAAAFYPDGSDSVRVTITASGSTVEIGNQATIPPPTDPDVAYPPGNDNGASQSLFEGFLYPTHAGEITGNRIQLGIDPSDVYTAWCALQTPYVVNEISTGDGGVQAFYGCLPDWETGPSNLPDSGPGCAEIPPDGGAILPVDCGKLALCSPAGGACSCTASGCTSRSYVPSGAPANQYPLELDATLDSTGAFLTGTLAMPSSGGTTALTVHLTKP